MERVKVLIDKLVQQQQHNESADALLITTQLLQNELLLQQKNSKPSGSSKVAVVMPSVATPVMKREPAVKQAQVQVSEQVIPKVSAPAVPQPAPAQVNEPVPVQVNEPVPPPTAAPVPIEEAAPVAEKSKPEPVLEEERIVYTLPEIPEHEAYLPQQSREVKKEAEQETVVQPVINETHFDAIEETPTLAQYQPPKKDNKLQKEINELIGEPKETLNDRLKENRKELAHILKETPIKDLRKAIGVNDRFVFVNELFRGDETMYERSIKTINGFHILPEAEYWINRELKVKLGWDDHKDSVQHFYHLVRRRFS